MVFSFNTMGRGREAGSAELSFPSAFDFWETSSRPEKLCVFDSCVRNCNGYFAATSDASRFLHRLVPSSWPGMQLSLEICSSFLPHTHPRHWPTLRRQSARLPLLLSTRLSYVVWTQGSTAAAARLRSAGINFHITRTADGTCDRGTFHGGLARVRVGGIVSAVAPICFNRPIIRLEAAF